MDHSKYRELLERHIDGELSPEERESLFEHMEFCDDCREMLEAEERLVDNLSRIPRLVAPSDLRAQILQELAREREEMMLSLDSDEHADEHGILRDDKYGQVPFSGYRRRVGQQRPRTIWQRYSPGAAVGFAVVAALFTLFISDFSNVQPLAQVQGVLRRTVRSATSALSSSLRTTVSPGIPTDRQLAVTSTPAPVQVDIVPAESNSTPPTSQQTLPSVLGRVTGQFERLQNAVTLLAEAATFRMPPPAEKAKPITTAIVLKPTDRREALSLDPDPFGDVLYRTAEAQPGGRVDRVDQFALEGYRYRVYTLQVSDSLARHLVDALERYRAPADGTLVRVFRDQGYPVSEPPGIAFFSASSEDFRRAVAACGNSAEPASRSRRVQVFVVE